MTHESSLSAGLGGVRFRRGDSVCLPPKGGMDAIGDTRRKFIRPLVYRLVGDANCLGGSGNGPAEQLNGLSFEHGPLNHSSGVSATVVQAMVTIMPEPLKSRLAQAMKRSNVDVATLARELRITYQGVKKLVDGKSSVMSAINNSKAAKVLCVNPDWLANGEGEMLAAPWPFPLVDRKRFDALGPEARGYVQKAMNDALDECEAAHEKSEAPTIVPRQAAGAAVRAVSNPFSAKNHPGRRATDRKGRS